MDSFRELPKIRPVFTNPTNPHESWRILSTIAWNESLRIQAGGLANLDSQIQTLKICIVDLFRRPVIQRFVLWIRFVGLFSKDSFCKTKNLKRFDSFRFGRIRVRIPHPYEIVIQCFSRLWAKWIFILYKIKWIALEKHLDLYSQF